jgi:hypothetical protein
MARKNTSSYIPFKNLSKSEFCYFSVSCCNVVSCNITGDRTMMLIEKFSYYSLIPNQITRFVLRGARSGPSKSTGAQYIALVRKHLKWPSLVPLHPDFDNDNTDMQMSKAPPKFLSPKIFTPRPPKIDFTLVDRTS